LLTVILACLILAACSSNNPEQQPGSSRSYTVRFTDPAEYRTNVLSVAQTETPFTIIIPLYIPANIDPTPNFAGRARNEYEVRVPLLITYKRQTSDSDIVLIQELNSTIKTVPLSEDIYLTYLDTQVLEQKLTLVSFNSEGSQILVPGQGYDWNRNGIHFDLTVRELDRDEARKIVESMIK
jgi:hypothetical protein